MIIPSIMIAASLMGPIDSQENRKTAKCIALVESGNNHLAVGDGGKAIGAYQMHRKAWDDANKLRHAEGLLRHSWSSRFDPSVQEAMALSYIQWIKRSFYYTYGKLPTPTQVYHAYTMGFTKSKSVDFDMSELPSFKRNAIERFTNLHNR